MRAKMTSGAGPKRAGMRKPLKKKRANGSATQERALVQVVRKQGMRAMEVEGVTMVKDDDSLLVFKDPKLFLAPKGGAFVVQGKPDIKTAQEGLAHLLGGMGNGGFGAADLQRIKEIMEQAKSAQGAAATGLGADVASFDDADEDEEED